MANINDMNEFLVATDVEDGDVLTFVDAGAIKEVDFSPAKDGTDMNKVFHVTISLPSGQEKKVSLNRTSRNSIAEAYGADTEKWVGKKIAAEKVKQSSWGKIRTVLYFKPVPSATITDETGQNTPF